jgi:hypothetical protein
MESADEATPAVNASGTAAADGANADIANAVRPTQWVSMRVIAQTPSNNPTSTGRQDFGSVSAGHNHSILRIKTTRPI